MFPQWRNENHYVQASSVEMPSPKMEIRSLSLIHLAQLSTLGYENHCWDFPGGTVDKSLLAHAGDTGSIAGLGRFHMPWSN